VLEMGCGAGGALSLTNFLRGQNTSITALDLSPDMLQFAKKTFEQTNSTLYYEIFLNVYF
jgi:methylase of polypeptide subunit release factors